MRPIVKPAKLLLVDDKPANLLVLEAVLDAGAYQLLFAHSGAEALALLKQHEDIALILLDVQMPEMDGFEVAKRIKAMPERRDIPIIFITAVYNESPFVIKGYQAGAVDYVSKPFDPNILKLKVGIYTSFRQKAELLKERERQIKESEELLQTGRQLMAILGTLPVGVIIADVDGRIIRANEEGLRLWKMFEHATDDARGEFLGWRRQEGRLLAEIEGRLTQALKGGGASHNEIVPLASLDGSSRSVFSSVSPLRGHDRRTMGAVVVLQDVTEHRRIEGYLERRIHHLVSSAAEFEVATGG